MYVEEVHRSPFYFLLICNVLIKIHNLLKCDKLIHGNQYILVNIINICISGECLLLESERVEYGEIYWKISI